MNTTHVKRLVLSGLCIAMGVVLPLAFHAIPQGGSIFLPMHLPVLLCGLACGWPYGLACGALTPLLSSLLTSNPPAAYLPSMVCELAVYGLAAGILYRYLHTGKRLLDIYLQLIGAMLLGRIVYGVLNALVFSAGRYSFSIFISAAFVKAVPGIAIQLILLPAMLLLLEKIHVLEQSEQRVHRQ